MPDESELPMCKFAENLGARVNRGQGKTEAIVGEVLKDDRAIDEAGHCLLTGEVNRY